MTDCFTQILKTNIFRAIGTNSLLSLIKKDMIVLNTLRVYIILNVDDVSMFCLKY